MTDHDAAEGANWERNATWWQEHFTQGADPEYEEQILPLAARLTAGCGRVLEVGTGEGQVARTVAAHGAALVVGVEPAAAQVAAAGARDGGVRFARATAADLPFADASFDAVVVCLVLEHVDDLDGAMAEIARVVRPGGRFVLFVNHPLLQTPDAGWIDDHMVDPPEQYWRIGPYLTEQAFVDEVEAGVFVRFVHRPLGRYLNALFDHGFSLEEFHEPPPPPGFLARAAEYRAASAVPRLLVLVGRRTG